MTCLKATKALMIVSELSRSANEWVFNALGQPVRKASRLQSLIRLYE